MPRNSDRVQMMLALSLCFALASSACNANTTTDGAGGGSGGVGPAPMTPVTGSTGSGGAAPAAQTGGSGGKTSSAMPPQSGSGGHAASGSGGSSANTGSGGAAPASDGGTQMMASGDAGPVTPSDAGTETGHEDLGKGDGSDVVTIGDSWMQIATNGGGIEGGLDRAGTAYRHYSVPGTLLLNGQIPSQYDQAKAINPDIKTVIMTGGGNDIMFSNGCATKEACTMAVQQIADGLDMLWSTMATDGVKDVIYIAYSKNAGTAPSDTRPDTAPVPKICTTGKIICHSVDTTDLVGPTDTVDGIHPTLPACDAIAKRVLDLMEKQGVRR